MATNRRGVTSGSSVANGVIDPSTRLIDLTVGQLSQIVFEAATRALTQARPPQDPRAVLAIIKKLSDQSLQRAGATPDLQRQIKTMHKQMADDILPLIEQTIGSSGSKAKASR